MKKRTVKAILAMCIALVMVLGACAPSAPAPAAPAAPAAPGAEAPAAPAETITLRFGHNQPTHHAWHMGAEILRDKLYEYSGGVIELLIFPDAVLGGEADMVVQVREGSLDFTISAPGNAAPMSPKFDLFSLPFLLRDVDHWTRVMDGPLLQEYNAIIAEETGLAIAAVIGGSTRSVLSRFPFDDMSALQGYTLRLMPSELHFAIWDAIGTLNITVPFGELYSALAAGLMDGAENELPSIYTARLFEVAPYFILTEHEITVRPIFMNQAMFDGLSPDLQDAMVRAFEYAKVATREFERQAAAAALDSMVNTYGWTIIPFDNTPLREATRPVIEDWAERNGLSDLANRIMAA